MITDDNKIRAVLGAYIQLVRQLYGKFTNAAVPLKGKHRENCLSFYELAISSGASLSALMIACLDYYPPWWCKKIFNREYPNVMILVSEKSRNRGIKNFPKTLAADAPDAVAQFYADQLKNYGEKIVSGLLINGFLPSEDMRGPVMEILEKEWAANGAGK